MTTLVYFYKAIQRKAPQSCFTCGAKLFDVVGHTEKGSCLIFFRLYSSGEQP